MKNKLSLILFSISFYCVMSSNVFAASKNYNVIDDINVSDGISKVEAFIIAKAFYWKKISDCGIPDMPISENGNWVSATRIGYTGIKGKSIVIDKKTGDITWGSKIIALQDINKPDPNNPSKNSRFKNNKKYY